MSNLRRAYANQRLRLTIKRIGTGPQSAADINIYHYKTDSPMKRGRIQTVFSWMRSGEWLSQIMAAELWGMSNGALAFCIYEIRKRGFEVEQQVCKRTNYQDGTFKQYRLVTWEPKDRRTL